MNQFPESVFVKAEGIGRVEAANTSSAQRAAALLIQWKPAQKRRAALYAEVFGRERTGLGETVRTYGDARNATQRLSAQAALIGEDQAKKLTGEFSDEDRREVE